MKTLGSLAKAKFIARFCSLYRLMYTMRRTWTCQLSWKTKVRHSTFARCAHIFWFFLLIILQILIIQAINQMPASRTCIFDFIVSPCSIGSPSLINWLETALNNFFLWGVIVVALDHSLNLWSWMFFFFVFSLQLSICVRLVWEF